MSSTNKNWPLHLPGGNDCVCVCVLYPRWGYDWQDGAHRHGHMQLYSLFKPVWNVLGCGSIVLIVMQELSLPRTWGQKSVFNLNHQSWVGFRNESNNSLYLTAYQEHFTSIWKKKKVNFFFIFFFTKTDVTCQFKRTYTDKLVALQFIFPSQ